MAIADEFTWTFSALDDACVVCRAFDGVRADYSTERYRFFEGPHGCARGTAEDGRCCCRCSLMGAHVTPRPPADRPLPFRTGDQSFPRYGGALTAGVSIGPDAWQLEDGMSQTQREAIAFRRLGEAAEESGDVPAAIKHYSRAVQLWWMVGCRRRRDQLLKRRRSV